MTVAARPVSWLDSAIPSPSSMKMPQPTPPIISVHSLGNVEVGSPPSQGKLLLSGVPIMTLKWYRWRRWALLLTASLGGTGLHQESLFSQFFKLIFRGCLLPESESHVLDPGVISGD